MRSLPVKRIFAVEVLYPNRLESEHVHFVDVGVSHFIRQLKLVTELGSVLLVALTYFNTDLRVALEEAIYLFKLDFLHLFFLDLLGQFA